MFGRYGDLLLKVRRAFLRLIIFCWNQLMAIHCINNWSQLLIPCWRSQTNQHDKKEVK